MIKLPFRSNVIEKKLHPIFTLLKLINVLNELPVYIAPPKKYILFLYFTILNPHIGYGKSKPFLIFKTLFLYSITKLSLYVNTFFL